MHIPQEEHGHLGVESGQARLLAPEGDPARLVAPVVGDPARQQSEELDLARLVKAEYDHVEQSLASLLARGLHSHTFHQLVSQE